MSERTDEKTEKGVAQLVERQGVAHESARAASSATREEQKNKETEKPKNRETEESKSVLSMDKKSVGCYECEEAKRHAEKTKNRNWVRKEFDSYFHIFVLLGVGLGLGFLGWVNILWVNKIWFVVGTLIFLFSVAMLAFKFYQEIFQGFSLYYFETADGVLHAHLKRPTAEFVRNLPMPVIVKIGVCGWFRKSRLLHYEKPGKITVASTYKGLKVHKAPCDAKMLELRNVTLEDEDGDRITFVEVEILFDYLEEGAFRLPSHHLKYKYLLSWKGSRNPSPTTIERIRLLFSGAKNLNELVGQLAQELEKKENELSSAQAETEKYKEIAEMYASYEQGLIDWIAQSKDNPNLGKSKHAQAIRQKLLEHRKAVEKKYGKIF